LSGSGFTAQLWYAPGDNQPESSLVPALPVTTFRTGPAAGYVIPLFLTLEGTMIGGSATVEMRVWDNAGGTITTWDQATYRGKSSPINVANLTPGDPTPPFLVGLQSFGFYDPIPEPSTWALSGLGAVLLVLLRRRAG